MYVSVVIEAYFPSDSPLSLSGEINANKGSEEDGRSENGGKNGKQTKAWI